MFVETINIHSIDSIGLIGHKPFVQKYNSVSFSNKSSSDHHQEATLTVSGSTSASWSCSSVCNMMTRTCDNNLNPCSPLTRAFIRLSHYNNTASAPVTTNSSRQHRQDQTVVSCLVGGVNRIGDKSRPFSVVLTIFLD